MSTSGTSRATFDPRTFALAGGHGADPILNKENGNPDQTNHAGLHRAFPAGITQGTFDSSSNEYGQDFSVAHQ